MQAPVARGVDEPLEEDLVDGLQTVRAEMEELFDSDVTETDDESEKDDDDDDVDDVDDVDEEDENAEMIHERAHVVEADAPLVEGGSREPGGARRHARRPHADPSRTSPGRSNRTVII